MQTTKPSSHQFQDDLDLVTRAAGGHKGAQSDLVERLECVPKLVRARLRRHGAYAEPALVDDLSQQVFMAIWGHLDRYRGDAPLEGWAYAYVVRTVAARTRMDRNRRTSLGVGRAGDTMDVLPAPPPQDTSARELIESLLGRMDAEGEQLIRLRYFQGLGHAELAIKFECSERAVRARFQRAMSRLRELAARAGRETR